MPSIIAAALGVFASFYLSLVALLRLTHDAKEPPSICDGVPFLSPILTMASKGVHFYRSMRDKHNLPIYTLRMPGSRIYVVNDTSLIPPIQSQFRTLSFTAIEAGVAAHLIGVDDSTNAIIGRSVTEDGSYLMSFPKYIHPALSAGASLDSMNRRAAVVISESLDAWAARGNDVTVGLFQWIRHELLLATTESVYGPNNPFRDPAVEKAWYTFEPGMLMFIMRLIPQITAKESYKAREFIVKAWEAYFNAGSHEDGSDLIKARVKINNDFGISLQQTARIELGGCQAILTNTLPGAFWLIFHLFSDVSILADVRAEVTRGVIEEPDGSRTIDLSFVKDSCPALLSTFKEVMRFHSSSISTRMVMQDHILDGKYLLRKGATVMIPSHVQHTSHSIWGEATDNFRHRRFIHEPGTKAPNPLAFRGFGGGTTLCPGRHFASTEILMFAALLVLRFDVTPVSGKWAQPSTAKSSLVNALPVPDQDLQVVFHLRDTKKWNVRFLG